MAFAPYWLMPTPWPQPVPVMVMPFPAAADGCSLDVPEAVTA